MTPRRPSRPRPCRSRLRAWPAVALLALFAGCGGGSAGPLVDAGDPIPPDTPLPAVDVSRVASADTGSPLPEGWEHGAFMQVFVRSYRDSDGDGIGDLRGLTERLDYLHDLGVRGLWLMPVGPSQDGDHGYAVTDYRAIEPDYGSLADFDALLREAHARGIGVIVDYVINHSAAEHPLFVNARAAADNPWRGWYLWQPSNPGGWNIYGGDPWRRNAAPGGGWYFAAFWDQMPDFDLRQPAVVDWHHDNLRFWLNRGVDGFRFDAVGHLVENGPQAWTDQPETLPLLRGARLTIDDYERRHLVCEGPNRPFDYTAACGSAFAFGLHTRILQAARGDPAGVFAVAEHFRGAPQGMATMLANHDSFAGDRVFNQLAGDLGRYRVAAATYLLGPGTPFIYYGEEIGMARGPIGGDPGLRTPMSWSADPRTGGFTSGTPYRVLSGNVTTFNVASQQADPESLLAFYKAMLALRNGIPALAAGRVEQVRSDNLVLAVVRRAGASRTLVVINYDTAVAGVEIDGLPARAPLLSRHPDGGADLTASGDGRVRVDLPAQSVRVFTVQ